MPKRRGFLAMSKLVADALVDVLRCSRITARKSQRDLAKSLGHSLSTIQAWEYGTAKPPFEGVVEWLDVCGVNPLRFYLQCLHPDFFDGLSAGSTTDELRSTVLKYFSDISPDSEIRKLAFFLFGGTGSSWPGQVDELCALNHLQIKDRIDIAELIYSKYNVAKATNTLRQPELIQPDMSNFRAAIDSCYKAVSEGKDEYTV